MEKVIGNRFEKRGNVQAENISANRPNERHSVGFRFEQDIPSRGWTQTGVICLSGSGVITASKRVAPRELNSRPLFFGTRD